MAMHSLVENVLKRTERKRKQKSEEEEEEEDDNEEDNDEEEGEDKIEFNELEDPEEISDVTSPSPNREHIGEGSFENVETTTERVRKLVNIETSRQGDNSDIGDQNSIKAKVKVKKRNIMFRAE